MKKVIKNGMAMVIIIAILTSCSQNSKGHKEKDIVTIYGDYKCPYCKKVEEKIMPKLKMDYIDKGKIKYRYINMAFLGKDSIQGSRAGHAVQNIKPEKYLEFQKLMYSKQSNNEKEWITEKLIDKQIDKLNINYKEAKKIKKDYKTKNSKSWKDANQDRKTAENKKIEEAPTVFINGKKVQNPYNYSEYQEKLK
ncbi:DsbA family protein (plasmid) [Staphylococcus xylosus]|uniref:DsbA family protein n=1 Tax=Staphylococcus xylosus TaxID=1288 RepID=UPI00403EF6B1